MNLGRYESIGTLWIALYGNDNNVTYFDSFGVENIPRGTKKFTRNRNILTNVYRTQSYYTIMWG